MILHLRMAANAPAPIDAVRALAEELRPGVVPVTAGRLEDGLAVFILPQRVGAWVTGVAGLFGLLLGGIGMYALTAYWVALRTREIGVRMALGAGRGTLIRGVLRRGLVAPAVGAAVGVVGALFVGRLLGTFLFAVEPLDLPALLGALGALGLVSIAANLGPAWRASALDPVQALQRE
jgi:ABC-type antimicrobial peptide transport system permease subunit